MKNDLKSRDSIVKSCANIVLPLALTLGCYLILHGHLSPGGGFQGGVLIAGAVAILYSAYGIDTIRSTFNITRLKVSEDLGALGFIFLASLGIIYGTSFFGNIIHNTGEVGRVYSAGTIFWMNFAVGYKVLAGIGFLILIMANTLKSDDEKEEKR
ncbi:MnhB domain-containing protein [Haloimpatiens sp. FM7330]|uniref:MnhB domain-containing protein n=1 Tax=Haloimpatiens sp. FM7330 TaxID=3298610 RepID=UPI00362EE449